MNALLKQCRRLDIRLWAEGDALRYDAPKGALTPDLVASLKTHKPELLEALRHQETAEALRRRSEEWAGALEQNGGLSRPEAELEAARTTAVYAQNAGYTWAALREALADYPALRALVPDKPSPVDALPFGVPKLAVLRGKRVVRQGAFTGAQEVKT